MWRTIIFPISTATTFCHYPSQLQIVEHPKLSLSPWLIYYPISISVSIPSTKHQTWKAINQIWLDNSSTVDAVSRKAPEEKHEWITTTGTRRASVVDHLPSIIVQKHLSVYIPALALK